MTLERWRPTRGFIGRGAVLLRVDLPGTDIGEIELILKDGTLSLQGVRHDANMRSLSAFSHEWMLPSGVQEDRIEASFGGGVLKIRLPKTRDLESRKIAIKPSRVGS
jgi:HSP20 family protein